MGLSVAQKIIKDHLVSGTMEAGKPISIRIDQTLTQDATGTMSYLQFEALGVDRVKTELSVPSSRSRPGTVSTSRGRETESAIRCISNASAGRGKRSSVPTPTRRPAAE